MGRRADPELERRRLDRRPGPRRRQDRRPDRRAASRGDRRRLHLGQPVQAARRRHGRPPRPPGAADGSRRVPDRPLRRQGPGRRRLRRADPRRIARVIDAGPRRSGSACSCLLTSTTRRARCSTWPRSSPRRTPTAPLFSGTSATARARWRWTSAARTRTSRWVAATST